MKYNLHDPLSFSNIHFSTDIKCFPATHIGQIFNYILKTKAFEAEYIEQYKVKTAHSFLKSGMVRKIYVCSIKTVKLSKH